MHILYAQQAKELALTSVVMISIEVLSTIYTSGASILDSPEKQLFPSYILRNSSLGSYIVWKVTLAAMCMNVS